MSDTSIVLKQFSDQALACEQLGSPFTAALCRQLAARLDERSHFGRRILEWPGDPYADNVALRAAGAFHALVRTGWEPSLQLVYPPQLVSDYTLGVAIRDTLTRHDQYLTQRLASPPQTNEVARSAILLGAMLAIAGITRQPLELFEIGASAGLNLLFDRYRYELGEGRAWGSPDAALAIACDWRGTPPPLDAPLTVIARHGCDLHPIDPELAADRERLLAYVWADQTHRMQRLETALQIAAGEHRHVDTADAATWLEEKLLVPPQPGVTRVLFHTIVWQYLSEDTRSRITALLQRLGREATAGTPLAHLSVEADANLARGARVDLTVWPAGETVTLGRADFHGRWTEWS